MADVHLWPYGNAKEIQAGPAGKWQFTCQHGPNECLGNLIEACALKYITDPLEQQQFFVCMETHAQGVKIPNWNSFTEKCSPDQAANITTCKDGDEGNALQHAIAERTDGLTPKHTHVPWFTVNGVHNQDVDDQLMNGMLEYVC